MHSSEPSQHKQAKEKLKKEERHASVRLAVRLFRSSCLSNICESSNCRKAAHELPFMRRLCETYLLLVVLQCEVELLHCVVNRLDSLFAVTTEIVSGGLQFLLSARSS
jgi:hypothetical protein